MNDELMKHMSAFEIAQWKALGGDEPAWVGRWLMIALFFAPFIGVTLGLWLKANGYA